MAHLRSGTGVPRIPRCGPGRSEEEGVAAPGLRVVALGARQVEAVAGYGKRALAVCSVPFREVLIHELA